MWKNVTRFSRERLRIRDKFGNADVQTTCMSLYTVVRWAEGGNGPLVRFVLDLKTRVKVSYYNYIESHEIPPRPLVLLKKKSTFFGGSAWRFTSLLYEEALSRCSLWSSEYGRTRRYLIETSKALILYDKVDTMRMLPPGRGIFN